MKANQAVGVADTTWNPSKFEGVTNEIYTNDKTLSVTSEESIKCYEKFFSVYWYCSQPV